MSTLSYIGNVNIAFDIVQRDYPGAELYIVDGSVPGGKPTTRPEDITELGYVASYSPDPHIRTPRLLQLHLR